MDLFINSTFDYEAARKWTVTMEPFMVKLSIAYCITIFAIKWAMRNLKPFDLQLPLNIWNGILAVFSIIGFVAVTPAFLGDIWSKGISYTYTDIGRSHTANSAGYWTFLWCVSKIPELLDTIFIVLRKRPLMFMHWYHHALTGYFAFVTYHEENAYLIWVVWLNYLVHSFMYSYYMLRSLRFRVPPQVARAITFGQIVQFLITHAVMAHLAFLCFTQPQRQFAVTLKGFMVGAIMEVTYLVLWFRFFYISYIGAGGKKFQQHKESMKLE